ncbi:MAG: GH15 family glucan-1,4-alpha-glucosidase [Cryomorphaceae bacterium]|jgi:GH15 family glucan-1,4-alpha-glucosidase
MTDNYHQGMIGNGRTCALIEPDATISFCCLPDFDSGTVMAQLLDQEKGGSFGIEMVGGKVIHQGYDHHTAIFVTHFEGPEGILEIHDFMPRYPIDSESTHEDVAPDVVRILHLVEGTPRIRVTYDPKLEYARFPTKTVADHDYRLKSTTEGEHPPGTHVYESLYLYSDLDNEVLLNRETVTVTEDRFLLMTYHDKINPPTQEAVELMLQRTRAYWMLWSAKTKRTHLYESEIIRSAITLKMLQFSPSGAFVAAATTSLPETIGEERNWDYRFCWIRDAAMTVATLHRIDHPWMARRFVDWVLSTVRTKDDTLQIMYGLRGEKELTEETLNHLDGYLGSKPVRIGNAAYHQEQHDIYGVLLDIVWQDLCKRPRTPEAMDRIWTRVRAVVKTVSENWHKPDHGIWEIRGEKRHFVFSKVLCWVALDRSIKIARMLEKNTWADAHEDLRDLIHKTICRKGWKEEVGAFTQSYESNDLDSANLLMADFGFLPGSDPRFVATVTLCQKQLCRNGLMYRYKNTDDFGHPSSAFTVCSFWMVKALVQSGRKKDAHKMFARLLKAANPHGLYGEDLDFETLRHLGNFPQAYSHLALIDCALLLDAEEPFTERLPPILQSQNQISNNL